MLCTLLCLYMSFVSKYYSILLGFFSSSFSPSSPLKLINYNNRKTLLHFDFKWFIVLFVFLYLCILYILLRCRENVYCIFLTDIRFAASQQHIFFTFFFVQFNVVQIFFGSFMEKLCVWCVLCSVYYVFTLMILVFWCCVFKYSPIHQNDDTLRFILRLCGNLKIKKKVCGRQTIFRWSSI